MRKTVESIIIMEDLKGGSRGFGIATSGTKQPSFTCAAHLRLPTDTLQKYLIEKSVFTTSFSFPFFFVLWLLFCFLFFLSFFFFHSHSPQTWIQGSVSLTSRLDQSLSTPLFPEMKYDYCHFTGNSFLLFTKTMIALLVMIKKPVNRSFPLNEFRYISFFVFIFSLPLWFSAIPSPFFPSPAHFLYLSASSWKHSTTRIRKPSTIPPTCASDGRA